MQFHFVGGRDDADRSIAGGTHAAERRIQCKLIVIASKFAGEMSVKQAGHSLTVERHCQGAFELQTCHPAVLESRIDLGKSFQQMQRLARANDASPVKVGRAKGLVPPAVGDIDQRCHKRTGAVRRCVRFIRRGGQQRGPARVVPMRGDLPRDDAARHDSHDEREQDGDV